MEGMQGRKQDFLVGGLVRGQGLQEGKVCKGVHRTSSLGRGGLVRGPGLQKWKVGRPGAYTGFHVGGSSSEARTTGVEGTLGIDRELMQRRRHNFSPGRMKTNSGNFLFLVGGLKKVHNIEFF